MSEYLSSCPQCRQRILCDTQYTGQRVACPLCLHEIIMPAPPPAPEVLAAPALPVAATPVPAPAAGGAARNKSVLILAVTVGLGALVLAGTLLWTFQGARRPVASVNAPAAAPAAPAPLVSAVAIPPHPTPKTAPEVASLCRAWWTFDQDQGPAATDASGHGCNAALAGGATWSKTARVGGGALHLPGTGYAETAGPVVDTSRSFTVTAWVNLFDVRNPQPCQTVASMDGNEVSAFFLQFNHSAGDRFVFNRLESDDASAATIMARANTPPVPNTWYHLAGVYDADAKTLSLYENGVLQESVGYASAWPASGRTALGRGYFMHAKSDFFNGLLDDVHFYAAALTAAQILALAAK